MADDGRNEIGQETVDDLRESIATFGLEDTFRAYYSSYRAIVMATDDPQERGRIQISCPEVGHDPLVKLEKWVSPAVDVTGDRFGWFNPPLVGSRVRVEFDNGDPGEPKSYSGGWSTKAETKSPVPKEFGYVDGKPQKRGFRSRAGHLLLFNDAPGEESVRLVWHKIADGDPAKTDPDKVAKEIAGGDKFSTLSFDEKAIQIRDADGALICINTEKKEILIRDANGHYISSGPKGLSLVDSGGNSVVLPGTGDVNIIAKKNINLNAPNINIKSGGVFLGDGAALSVAIAELLLPWLSGHTHVQTVPPGTPTGPAAAGALGPPPPFQSLSVKIKP
jgi:hypothetical protein